LELGQQHNLFLKKIRDYSASKKITVFLEALDGAEAQGYNTRKYLNSMSQQWQAVMNAEETGRISGTANGGKWSSAAVVLVFDRHGFFEGLAETDPTSRRLFISNLPKGEYYIVARSHLQNRWQCSGLVEVEVGKGGSGVHIDFSRDIEAGFNSNSNSLLTDDASIKGTVTGKDELPLGFAFVFAFDLADTSIAGFTVSDFDSARFSIDSLAAGSYLAYADSYVNLSIQLDDTTTFGTVPHLGEYYDNAPTPDQATPITLVQSEVREGVDFSLESGGAISGRIKDETGAPLDSLVIIAAKIDLDNPSKFITENIDFSMTSSDVQGNYTLSGLSSGDYILRTISFINPDFMALFEGKLSKHAGLVLDEYYSGVQNLFSFSDATLVTVTEPDTTLDVNFNLVKAGAISGNFVEFAGGAPVQGDGSVLAFNAETGFPELAMDFDTLSTSYEIRPLPQGEFKLMATVNSETITYLPQFYDLKDFEDADLVPVSPPSTTENINFTMVRAGSISGEVIVPTSSEFEPDVLLVAFDAASGEVASVTEADSLTYAYTISGLAAGNYLVEALPATQGLAGTYHGGGTSFNHANSVMLTVASDATTQADITLMTGEGLISGTVTDLDGNPLAGILVIAYDETGHAVSDGVSGMDSITGQLNPDSGDFVIPGLVSGNYFVRTFSFFQLLSLAEAQDAETDLLTLILGLLFEQDDLGNFFEVKLYSDAWYPNQVIEIDLDSLDLVELIFGSLLSGGDLQSLLPLFDIVPEGAMTITVSSPGQQSDINFALPVLDLGNILTDIEELPANDLIAESFQLFQNYPNPFNPVTTISYQMPELSFATLKVYDVLGREVVILVNEEKPVGSYEVEFNATGLPSGIYFYRLQAGDYIETKKMVLMK
jgi:hypothetical protein